MSITDTAYFVFGENLEVYNTNKQTHQEFMEAGLEFIKQVGLIIPLPIFKYFPSIAYRKFIQATERMRELGKPSRLPLNFVYYCYVHLSHIVRFT